MRRLKVSPPKVSFRRFSEKSKSDKTIGQAPGTLVYTGKKTDAPIEFELFSYDANDINAVSTREVKEILNQVDGNRVNWVNTGGLHDESVIEEVGNYFGLHTLLLEDILHVDQRPKSEDFGSYLFFTIKMFHEEEDRSISYEHVSFVLSNNLIISFQENPKDLFDLLRERLINSYGKIREKGADYLFYRFVDTIIDNYFLVLDRLAERLEAIEDEVMDRPDTLTLQKLQKLRKETIYLRRSIYPIRESINYILKSETELISKETERFFTDVYDHTIQVIESLETYRDLHSSIMDLYMNTASNRMNEIMKVLTIMSTIFIPITFIAGIYGMNFTHMPELDYPYAYPMLWGLILIVALGMIFFFKSKKWL